MTNQDRADGVNALINSMATAVRRAGGFTHLASTETGRATIIKICANEAIAQPRDAAGDDLVAALTVCRDVLRQIVANKGGLGALYAAANQASHQASAALAAPQTPDGDALLAAAAKGKLCSDCPPIGDNDDCRCDDCPRREIHPKFAPQAPGGETKPDPTCPLCSGVGHYYKVGQVGPLACHLCVPPATPED